MPDSKASKAADLKRFLQILPYGDEGVFGFGGWRWSTPHPDESVGSVKLVDDLIIKEPVVEVASAASIKNKSVSVQFPDEEKYTGIGARLPIANFQLKYIGKDTGIEIKCTTENKKPYYVIATNSTTICKLKGTQLCIPLTLVDGWNKVEIDLEYLLGSIGQRFVSVESVTVYSSCRLRKIFFSDTKYNDWELPYKLRVLPILETQFKKLSSESTGESPTKIRS